MRDIPNKLRHNHTKHVIVIERKNVNDMAYSYQ